MTIAIDFDGTFAADPVLFGHFVNDALRMGHTCLILTGRSDEGEYGDEVRRLVRQHLNDANIPIVFAGMAWKRDAAKARGFNVDVFIDDTPEYIAPQNILFSQHKQEVK